MLGRKARRGAADFAALRLVVHYDESQGRFTPQTLLQAVPDLAQRSTWMCGPAGLMDAVHAYWADVSLPVPSPRFLLTRQSPTTFGQRFVDQTATASRRQRMSCHSIGPSRRTLLGEPSFRGVVGPLQSLTKSMFI